MRKPCNNCPFRKTAAQGWLGEERAAQIVNNVQRGDDIFYCHKTVDYSNDTGGRVTDKTKLCAGSIGLHKKEGRPNRVYRMVDHKIGGEELVVDSSEAFVKRHTFNKIWAFFMATAS